MRRTSAPVHRSNDAYGLGLRREECGLAQGRKIADAMLAIGSMQQVCSTRRASAHNSAPSHLGCLSFNDRGRRLASSASSPGPSLCCCTYAHPSMTRIICQAGLVVRCSSRVSHLAQRSKVLAVAPAPRMSQLAEPTTIEQHLQSAPC